MMFDQRGGVHISNRTNDGSIHVRNARINWGTFHNFPTTDINLESTTPLFPIPPHAARDILFTGNATPTAGTEGQFDLFDNDIKICTVHWLCPAGSTQNECYISDRNPAASISVNVGDWVPYAGAAAYASGGLNLNTSGSYGPQQPFMGPYSPNSGVYTPGSSGMSSPLGGHANLFGHHHHHHGGIFGNHGLHTGNIFGQQASGMYGSSGAYGPFNNPLNNPLNQMSGYSSLGNGYQTFGPLGQQVNGMGGYGGLGHFNVEITRNGRTSRL